MVEDGKTREKECERKLLSERVGEVRKRVKEKLERETKTETAGERHGAWFN